MENKNNESEIKKTLDSLNNSIYEIKGELSSLNKDLYGWVKQIVRLLVYILGVLIFIAIILGYR